MLSTFLRRFFFVLLMLGSVYESYNNRNIGASRWQLLYNDLINDISLIHCGENLMCSVNCCQSRLTKGLSEESF